MGVRRINIVKHGDLHAGHARSGKNAQQRQETLGKARRRVWVINKQYGERTREMLELAQKICCPNKDCRTSEPTPGNGHVGSHVTHHRDAPSPGTTIRSVIASSQLATPRRSHLHITTSTPPRLLEPSSKLKHTSTVASPHETPEHHLPSASTPKPRPTMANGSVPRSA